MITWNPGKAYFVPPQDGEDNGRYFKEGSCMEKDIPDLPTNVANGSRVVVMDKGEVLMFDQEESEWNPFE